MSAVFKNIYRVSCPCEIRDTSGNLVYERGPAGRSFTVPLPAEFVIHKGDAEFLGTSENFYGVTPPPMPAGWHIECNVGPVARKAEIFFDTNSRRARINFDAEIFNDPDVPEGVKIFMFFHELGHLIHGPNESNCDEFAFWHSLRAGVSPFMCYVAIRAYMPENYAYRIENLGRLLRSIPQLKNSSDE